MVIHLSTMTCKQEGMALSEVLAILLMDQCKTTKSVNNVFKVLQDKDWIRRNEDGTISINYDIEKKVSRIILAKDPNVPEEDKLLKLAIKMQALFPKGTKPGTNYYWRGNKPEIVGKLQKFYKIVGKKISEEDILDATKRYVESFNGDYSYMKLLKYFILKQDVPVGGTVEQVSELASFIENKGQESESNSDWTTTMI